MSRVLLVAVICAALFVAVSADRVDAEAEALETERLSRQTLEEMEMFRTGVRGFKPPKKPANKLPATASDNKADKQSIDKDKKAIAPSAPKSKNNQLGTKVAALKSVVKGMSKDVSVVSKQVFAQLKAAKVGSNIKSIIAGIKEFKDKVSSFFHSLNPFRFANPRSKSSSSSAVTAKKICHWVMSVDNNYKSTGWQTSNLPAEAHSSTWNPGTCSVGTKIDRLGSYNCFSDSTQKSVPLAASASANANFICVDADNTVVSPPGQCKTKISFYSGYKASTYSWSDSGWKCPLLGSRYIQVSAAHEAQIQVNGNVPAAKGVVTTTGNSITETYSFTFSAVAKAGVGKDGPEVSGEAGVSIGYTVNEIRDFGEKKNVLAMQHQGNYDAPLTAILSTVASTQINGEGRVFGLADSHTEAWLMCIVATSTDCGMANTGTYFGVGDQAQLNAYADTCKSMMRNNNIKI